MMQYERCKLVSLTPLPARGPDRAVFYFEVDVKDGKPTLYTLPLIGWAQYQVIWERTGQPPEVVDMRDGGLALDSLSYHAIKDTTCLASEEKNFIGYLMAGEEPNSEMHELAAEELRRQQETKHASKK